MKNEMLNEKKRMSNSKMLRRMEASMMLERLSQYEVIKVIFDLQFDQKRISLEEHNHVMRLIEILFIYDAITPSTLAEIMDMMSIELV